MNEKKLDEMKIYLESILSDIDKIDNEEEKELYIEKYNEVIDILNDNLIDVKDIIRQKNESENKSGSTYIVVDEKTIKKIMEERKNDGEHSEIKNDDIVLNEEVKNKFLASISKEIHNRVNTIEKTIAESFGKITGTFKGVKDTITGIGTFIAHPIDTVKDIFSGNIFNSKEKSEEMMKIGISKKALNKTDVLNRSAIGVAIFWLAMKLGLANESDRGISGAIGGIKAGIKSFATRKLANFGGNMLMNLGKKALGFILNPYVIGAIVLAVGSYLLYKWWKSSRNKLAEDYATHRTTSDVLGRQATEKEEKRHDKLNFKYGAKQKTDKEADEFINRKANINGATAAAGTGLTLGVTAWMINAIPASTYLLGTALGPAALALASNPVGWAIAGSLAVGGLVWAGYKFFSNKDKVKKGGDQLIVEETEAKEKIKTYSNYKNDFDKKRKEKTMNAMVESAIKTKENTAYVKDIYETIKNLNIGGKPTAPNDNDTPSSGAPKGNDRSIPATSGDLIADAYKITHSQEAGGTNWINRNKKTGNLSAVGAMQYNWKAGNALPHLIEMQKQDPEAFKKYGWDNVLKRMTGDAGLIKGKDKNYITDDEHKQFNEMMKNSQKLRDFEDKQGMNRVAGLIATAQKMGITDKKALAMYADMANILPAYAKKAWSKDLIELSKTNPEEAIKKAAENFKQYTDYKSRIDRSMNMILKSDIGNKDKENIVKDTKQKDQTLTETKKQIETKVEEKAKKEQQSNLDKATQKFGEVTNKKAEEKAKTKIDEEQNIKTKNEEFFANFGNDKGMKTKTIIDLVLDYQFGERTFGERIMNGNNEIKISSLGGEK